MSCCVRWLTCRSLFRNRSNQFPHTVKKLLRYTTIFSTIILQMLTFSILDGGTVQFVIDPALGTERNIYMVQPHQVVDDGVGAGMIPALIKHNGCVLQNAALADALNSCRNHLLSLFVLGLAVCLFLFRSTNPAGRLLRLLFRPIYCGEAPRTCQVHSLSMPQ